VWMAIAVDASTPIRWTGTPNSNADITSASFTAPTDALLVQCVNWDCTVGGSTNVSVNDSGTLTWTKRVERIGTETTTGGYAGIWPAPTVSSAARTATTRQAGGINNQRLSTKLYVLTGVDNAGTPVDTVGASNEGGSTTNNLTTTSVTPGANGLLMCCDTDWNALGAFEASSDLTQDTDTYAGAISVCSGYKTCTSGAGVTGNLNAAGTSAAQHKWVQVTVREAGGGGRTTKNTRAFPLGMEIGMNWVMPTQ